MIDKPKKSFVMHEDFFEMFALLGMEDRGRLISAIFAYAAEGEVDETLSPVVKMAFTCIKGTLDRDREKYLNTCARNAENGKKGGRPRKLAPSETEGFSEKPKKAYSDSNSDSNRESESNSDGEGGGDTPPPAASATQADEEEFSAYAEERRERAAQYASAHGKKTEDVLRLWWSADRADRRKGKALPQRASPPSECSFDVDRFFAAALARSERELFS